MNRQANPKLIGGFVFGAVILSVAALFFFGRGGLFSQKENYILFFDRSVKGLSVGAPVMFRGVRIGQVADITVHVNPDNYTFNIPVVIRIDPNSIEQINGDQATLIRLARPDAIKMLIAKGLRAQLQLQSLVTGQLFVQLDMYPGTSFSMSEVTAPYPEIPTIPSELEELTRSIENIPIEEVVSKLMSTLTGVEELVHSPDLANALFKLNHGMSEFRQTVKNLDSGIGQTLEKLDLTMASIRELSTSLKGEAVPLATSARQTLAATQSAMLQSEQALAGIAQTLEGNTEIGFELRQTLEEIRKAARALKQLSEEIERHPEILLRGKNPGELP